jgi:RNA polymerase sigma factor (sigma-70 family)
MSSNQYRNEADLIAACLAGDQVAWEQFTERYRRIIRSTVAQIRRSYQSRSTDTDDLESHVYQRLLEDDKRRIRKWQGRSKFSTYLVQVVRNLSLDYFALRNQRPVPEEYQYHVEETGKEEGPAETELLEVRKQAFHSAMKILPAKQALIIQLRLEGKTLSEISAITKRPAGTISVENSRAMAKLRVALSHTLDQLKNGD